MPVKLAAFGDLLERLRSGECARGLEAVPYCRRGVACGQLLAMKTGLLDSGWLSRVCDENNRERAEAIQQEQAFPMALNLYSVDTAFVRPVTTPDVEQRAPVFFLTPR